MFSEKYFTSKTLTRIKNTISTHNASNPLQRQCH